MSLDACIYVSFLLVAAVLPVPEFALPFLVLNPVVTVLLFWLLQKHLTRKPVKKAAELQRQLDALTLERATPHTPTLPEKSMLSS
jgi:hypothetical protein